MTVSLASEIKFSELCNVLEEIKKARAAKKGDIWDAFIARCRIVIRTIAENSPDADVSLFPIYRLILPQLERERGPYNLKERSLGDLYVRILGLGKGSKDANKLVNYKAPTSGKFTCSDFAETVYWVSRPRWGQNSTDLTIEQINLFLDNISKRSETISKRDETFRLLTNKISAFELKWITRIILKDLKLGMGTKRILQALHKDASALFDVSSNLRQICDTLHNPSTRYEYGIEIFSHFKPMLLERCQIEDTDKLFVNGERYFVQSKYDGERSQLHMKDGRYKYFTRQGYDITKNPGYGETSSSGFLSGVFSRRLNPNCKSIILDGELMGWHKEKRLLGSKGMNYDVKKLSDKSHHQPCFIAYDVIMYNDDLLDTKPYEERLKILQSAFTEEEGCLMLSKSTKISRREELCKIFNESMKNKEEGIVIKKCDVTYKPNVRNGSGCYKMKAEYSDDLVEDVDLIVLGGYYGEGKCTGLIKSFLMGIASPPKCEAENPSKFLSVVSVSNGISMEALKNLTNKFQQQSTTERPANVTPPRLDPPNLWIRPEDSIIFTIRATEMTRSNDYPTGYSLRFPRVMKVRHDKPWYSVCTTTELKSLIKDAGPIQKLTKREVNQDDINEAPDTKVRKVSRPRSVGLQEKSMMANIYDNPPVPLTQLFNGNEVCVINGSDDLPKEKIDEILCQHGARVVQTPLKDNCCVIIGNSKTLRAKRIIETKKYDVVTLEWFKRVTNEENWSVLQDFFPWELLSTHESTERRLVAEYDEYYDSFFIDANEESLKRSFTKAEKTMNAVEFDRIQTREVDRELFDSELPFYSIFRDIVGYFDDESDCAKYEFHFMAGTVKENFDDSVTHVFISGNSMSLILRNLIENRSQRSLKTIRCQWIEDCFRKKQILPDTSYLV